MTSNSKYASMRYRRNRVQPNHSMRETGQQVYHAYTLLYNKSICYEATDCVTNHDYSCYQFPPSSRIWETNHALVYWKRNVSAAYPTLPAASNSCLVLAKAKGCAEMREAGTRARAARSAARSWRMELREGSSGKDEGKDEGKALCVFFLSTTGGQARVAAERAWTWRAAGTIA